MALTWLEETYINKIINQTLTGPIKLLQLVKLNVAGQTSCVGDTCMNNLVTKSRLRFNATLRLINLVARPLPSPPLVLFILRHCSMIPFQREHPSN